VFLTYKEQDDLVGMDKARGGSSRWSARGPDAWRTADPAGSATRKARAARVFYEKYVRAREDEHHKRRRKEWTVRFG
jgi:hypothetical protein